MNSLSAGTFDAYSLASVVADVRGLVRDSSTATEITFYARGTRAYDPGTGTVTYGDTGTVCSAFLGPLSWTQRQVPGAMEGDVQVLISISDLSESPTVGTRFTAGNVDYSVYRAETGPLLTHHVLLAHRAE